MRLPKVHEPPTNLALMVIGRTMAQMYWVAALTPLPERLAHIVREIEAREAAEASGR